MSDFTSIISQLESQREAIDRALAALRGLSGTEPVKRRGRPKKAAPARKKPAISEEGRKRIAEAQKARWAVKKAAAEPVTKKAVRKSAQKAKKAATKQLAD